jgi:hypothetical protein
VESLQLFQKVSCLMRSTYLFCTNTSSGSILRRAISPPRRNPSPENSGFYGSPILQHVFLEFCQPNAPKHSFFGARYILIPAKRSPIRRYRKITIMLFRETIRSCWPGSGKMTNPGSYRGRIGCGRAKVSWEVAADGNGGGIPPTPAPRYTKDNEDT